MSKPVPEKRLDEIVAAVKAHPNGANFLDVAMELQPIPRVRNLQRWMATLVRQGRILREGKTRSVRFKVPATTATNDLPYFASPEGGGIWRLVRQPLATRAPADYRRITLDRYRPNETYYLPAEFRARLGARRGDTTWKQKPEFDRVLAGLVSTVLELEDAFDPAAGTLGSWRALHGVASPLPILTDQEIRSWLAEPARVGVRPDAQLLWNVRAVFVDLVNAGPAAIGNAGWLYEMYGKVTAQMVTPTLTHRALGANSTAAPALLRTSPLVVPGTVYQPPSDPGLIASCFDQLFREWSVIADPAERAFFVLVHLLYLQPFGRFNPTMALLTMNVSLIAAGLPPKCFEAVLIEDLLAAFRGIWELNRTELLRDAIMFGV
jgi:hypothetical protein